MKINVKGLVFVGAAAAIMLSAGAANAVVSETQATTRAAGATDTVTSQKYTEGRYEWYDNKQGNAPATNSNDWASIDKYPSMKTMADRTITNVANTAALVQTGDDKLTTAAAVKAYANGGTNGELARFNSSGQLNSTHIVTTTETTTTNGPRQWKSGYTGSETDVPSEAAVLNALDTLATNLGGSTAKQTKSDSANDTTYKLGYTGDTWATLSTDNTTNYTKVDTTTKATPKIVLDTNRIVAAGTTAADFATAADTSATADKLTTVKSVKTYADSKVSSNETIANISSSSTTTAPNEKVVKALDTAKLDKNNTTDHKIGYNGGWELLSAAVSDDNQGFVTVTGAQDGSVTIGASAATTASAIGSASSSSSKTLVTDYAVKQYVATAGLGGELQDMPAACKDATKHCALVSTWVPATTGDNPVAAHMELRWTEMAQ